jgi:Cyclic nucleotide-binding domain
MTSKGSLGISQAVLRKKFRAGITLRSYRDQEVVFSQGDPADSLFYVESGTVTLTVITVRKKAIIAILQRGSFLVKAVWRDKVCGIVRRDQLDTPLSFNCKRRGSFAHSDVTRSLHHCLSSIWFQELFESRRI